MTLNLRPSEQAAIVGVIDPDANTAATYLTAYVPAKDFMQFMAVVFAGALGASATVDAKIVQATDSSGTGVKDVTGLAITQLTQAGTDSDKQAIINVRQDDLDINNGFTHLALSMTIAVATSDGGGVLLGFGPRFGPASDNDAASVAEIVG